MYAIHKLEDALVMDLILRNVDVSRDMNTRIHYVIDKLLSEPVKIELICPSKAVRRYVYENPHPHVELYFNFQ